MAEVTVELGHLLEMTDFELFDFDYEFDDPNTKAELEQAIIDFFYFYEIGQETPDRFKHTFKARFKRTISYYNKLHNTTLLEYNPLINYKISEALEQLANTSSNQDTTNDTTGNNTTEVTGSTSNDETVTATSTRTDDLSSTSETNRTDDLTQNTTSNEVTSDYPQQPIAGDYQDGERDTTTETTNTGTQDTNTTGTNTGTVDESGESTTSGSGTEDRTTTEGHTANTTANVTESGNTDMSYDKTIEGITGVTYQELIQKERANIVRMTTALINEMKPCFILVY